MCAVRAGDCAGPVGEIPIRSEGARIPPSVSSRGEGTRCVQLRTLPSVTLAAVPA